jgi:hypothetical protein
MAMPMLAQFLPAPAGGPVRGGRRGSRRAGQRIGLRLLASRAGNVAVEFALAAPVLMMLMLASAELARFVILHHPASEDGPGRDHDLRPGVARRDHQ